MHEHRAVDKHCWGNKFEQYFLGAKQIIILYKNIHSRSSPCEVPPLDPPPDPPLNAGPPPDPPEAHHLLPGLETGSIHYVEENVANYARRHAALQLQAVFEPEAKKESQAEESNQGREGRKIVKIESKLMAR